jgi:hypothetical protein
MNADFSMYDGFPQKPPFDTTACVYTGLAAIGLLLYLINRQGLPGLF